jgi:aspartate/methionine/tyrosine aminotransferase
VKLSEMNVDELIAQARTLTSAHEAFRAAALKLDVTRGKPATRQLDLSDSMEQLSREDLFLEDGTDLRNYGGLDGIPAAKKLGAAMLGVQPSEVLVSDNSSLTLMYLYVSWAFHFGPMGAGTAWRDEGPVKFLAVVPGYDRHFSICEELGIEMINVPFNADGPDMEQVEELVSKDPSIKGMWCVPKYSNPTGHTYSAETVDRISLLGKIAGPNFRVIWDNAYAVHDLVDPPPVLANVMERCKHHGTEDSVVQVASTSKITHAGAGISFLGTSKHNLEHFKKRLGIMSIGPNKINQQRHLRFLKDFNGLRSHMQRHAQVLRPKFELVQQHLTTLEGKEMGTWSVPEGGYFVSFDAPPGTARQIVALAAEVGVKLTPAGATFPYGRDPDDSNIRIAPSFPELEELDQAMQVFVNCVQLAAVQQRLQQVRQQ